MGILGSLQFLLLFILALVVFVAQIVALLDAARRPASAYTSEGKLSKQIWLAILGVAAVLGLLAFPPIALTLYNFLFLIAAVPAIVYWADVRPRIKPYGKGRGGSSGSGYGGGYGGGW